MASGDGLFTQEFAVDENASDTQQASEPSPTEINFDDTYVEPGMFIPDANDDRHNGDGGDSGRKRRSGSGGGHGKRSRRAKKPCCGCSRHSTCNRAPTARQSGCTCVAKGRPCTNCECPPGKCRNRTQLRAASGSLGSFLVREPTTTAPEETETTATQDDLETNGLLTQPPGTTTTTDGDESPERDDDDGGAEAPDDQTATREVGAGAATTDDDGQDAGGAPPPRPPPADATETTVEDGRSVQLCGVVADDSEMDGGDADAGSVGGAGLLTQPEEEPATGQDLREPERAMPDPQDARTPAQDRPNVQPGAPLATEEGAPVGVVLQRRCLIRGSGWLALVHPQRSLEE